MAKFTLKEPPKSAAAAEEKKVRKSRNLDKWLIVFVIVLLGLRFLAFEPFKIPSGSMEPTLIGHEDYGDRIVTNKLAYMSDEPKRFDVVVFKYDQRWENENLPKLVRNYIKRLVGLPGETIVISGGDLFLKDDAGVEHILRKWETSPELQERLWQPVAMPTFTEKPLPPEGEAGDWQASLARDVVRSENHARFPWNVTQPDKARGEGEAAPPPAVTREKKMLLVKGEATLTYEHAVTNAYCKMGRWGFRCVDCPTAHQPDLEAPNGVKVRNPANTMEHIRPYIPNTWSGVRCPNCKRVSYPLARDPEGDVRIAPSSRESKLKEEVIQSQSGGVRLKILEGALIAGDRLLAEEAATVITVQDMWRIVDDKPEKVDELVQGEIGQVQGPVEASDDLKTGKTVLFKVYPSVTTPYFYGGDHEVGDLKLEIEFESLANAGAMEIMVGSEDRHAGWIVSLGGERPDVSPAEGRHECSAEPVVEVGKRHVLSLAYVDGTVLATADGTTYPAQPIENIQPRGAAPIKSLARVRFIGDANVKVTRLDLYRDLHYTLYLNAKGPNLGPNSPAQHVAERTYTPEKGRYEFRIPDGYYMALGDNSPSSKDSREWGFFPRKNLLGRASFVWWPPSRCRIMY